MIDFRYRKKNVSVHFKTTISLFSKYCVQQFAYWLKRPSSTISTDHRIIRLGQAIVFSNTTTNIIEAMQNNWRIDLISWIQYAVESFLCKRVIRKHGCLGYYQNTVFISSTTNGAQKKQWFRKSMRKTRIDQSIDSNMMFLRCKALMFISHCKIVSQSFFSMALWWKGLTQYHTLQHICWLMNKSQHVIL